MHLQNTSNDRVRPLFCLNPACTKYHRFQTTSTWYAPHGSYLTIAHGRVRRFRCRHCNKTFSEQSFHFTYYAKCRYNYPILIRAVVSTMGIRAIGRLFSPDGERPRSAGSVNHHLARLARQTIAMRTRLCTNLKIQENLCADGIVNFIRSQYFKSQNHFIVGKTSQFIYHWDVFLQKRTGRMSSKQKLKNEEIQKRYTFDPQAYRKSVRRFLNRARNLYRAADSRLTLPTFFSDKDYLYELEFKKIFSGAKVTHKQISSKIVRTTGNELFPVNYLERQLRKGLHGYVRETTCVDRSTRNVAFRLCLFELEHNYLKKYRSNSGSYMSHAEVAGISTEPIKKEIYRVISERAFYRREKLSSYERQIWKGTISVPLEKKKRPHDLAQYILQ